MAAYFTHKDGSDFIRHRGSVVPVVLPQDIVAVQLDGDELNWVESHFTGLRTFQNGRTVTLYGDDARMVGYCWGK